MQLLANRGYAVLQVNFRGSTGFGKAFVKAADREFAGKMHDDLIDAVDWAVEQGYADRARVAIFGGSYGGYAALVGVTFTPDVFAAAIDYVGISSLVNFMRTLPADRAAAPGQQLAPVRRQPRRSRSRRPTCWPAHRSPGWTRSAHRCWWSRAPTTPRRAGRVRQSRRGAARAGVEVEYMVKDDEGHGFLNDENVIDMYRAVERFLAEHFGGRRSVTRRSAPTAGCRPGRHLTRVGLRAAKRMEQIEERTGTGPYPVRGRGKAACREPAGGGAQSGGGAQPAGGIQPGAG